MQQIKIYDFRLPDFINIFKDKVVKFILPFFLQFKQFINSQQNLSTVNPLIAFIALVLCIYSLNYVISQIFFRKSQGNQQSNLNFSPQELNQQINDMKKQVKSLKISFIQLSHQMNSIQNFQNKRNEQSKSQQFLSQILPLYSNSIDNNKKLVQYVIQSQMQVLKELKKLKKYQRDSLSSGRPSIRSRTSDRKLAKDSSITQSNKKKTDNINQRVVYNIIQKSKAQKDMEKSQSTTKKQLNDLLKGRSQLNSVQKGEVKINQKLIRSQINTRRSQQFLVQQNNDEIRRQQQVKEKKKEMNQNFRQKEKTQPLNQIKLGKQIGAQRIVQKVDQKKKQKQQQDLIHENLQKKEENKVKHEGPTRHIPDQRLKQQQKLEQKQVQRGAIQRKEQRNDLKIQKKDAKDQTNSVQSENFQNNNYGYQTNSYVHQNINYGNQDVNYGEARSFVKTTIKKETIIVNQNLNGIEITSKNLQSIDIQSGNTQIIQFKNQQISIKDQQISIKEQSFSSQNFNYTETINPLQQLDQEDTIVMNLPKFPTIKKPNPPKTGFARKGPPPPPKR